MKHPELIWTGGGMVYLLRETSRHPDQLDVPVVHAALTHVLKIEYLTEAAAPPVDRSTV